MGSRENVCTFCLQGQGIEELREDPSCLLKFIPACLGLPPCSMKVLCPVSHRSINLTTHPKKRSRAFSLLRTEGRRATRLCVPQTTLACSVGQRLADNDPLTQSTRDPQSQQTPPPPQCKVSVRVTGISCKMKSLYLYLSGMQACNLVSIISTLEFLCTLQVNLLC